MKAIINGKRYDTEKATLIGEASEGYYGDFRRWEEALYVTPRSKAYFIAGSGGGMSRWARKVEMNSWTGGSGILPISAEEAREWAEAYLPVEEVEKHFAGMVEDA